MNTEILKEVFKKPLNITLIVLNIINIFIVLSTNRFTWLTLALLALTILDFVLDYKNEKKKYEQLKLRLTKKNVQTEPEITKITKPNLGGQPGMNRKVKSGGKKKKKR